MQSTRKKEALQQLYYNFSLRICFTMQTVNSVAFHIFCSNGNSLTMAFLIRIILSLLKLFYRKYMLGTRKWILNINMLKTNFRYNT